LAQLVEKDDNRLVREIWDLLEPVVVSQGMEILEIEYRRESIGWVLRIFIDSENGVSVDHCATISRVAGDVLDVADLIPTSYHLEVSSPGLDRPLRKWEQFQKHVGDIVEIRTVAPLQARRNFKGPLKEASPEQVVVECDGKEYTIPLPLIERARLLNGERVNG
jgi:ribosome maturation factor RimP